MWLLMMVRWLALCLFIWFMLYEVFVPLWQKQPLFPSVRELFRKKEEPAKADVKQRKRVKRRGKSNE